MQLKERRQTRFKVQLPEMEGAVARWYARLRGSGSQIEAYRNQALQLTDGLPSGADVLEVAPGPGVPGHRDGSARTVSRDRAGHQPFVRGDR